jgi:hypothetical protein
MTDDQKKIIDVYLECPHCKETVMRSTSIGLEYINMMGEIHIYGGKFKHANCGHLIDTGEIKPTVITA